LISYFEWLFAMRGLFVMRGLQPRSFILLPPAIVFIATGDTIQLRNWKFRRAFGFAEFLIWLEELGVHSFRIAGVNSHQKEVI